MEQFKRAQVIILSTNNNSDLELHTKRNKLYSKQLHNTNFDYNKMLSVLDWYKQHLYIISDDEIKEGNWCIMLDDLGNIFSIPQQWKSVGTLNKNLRKIIATTDLSLINNDKTLNGKWQNRQLPQPSQQFIEKYIEEYNKGNIITNVLVEYDNLVEDVFGNQHLQTINDGELYLNTTTLISSNLKINPKDNTITIKKLKDSWNREEVIQLLKAVLYTNNITLYRYPDNSVSEIDKNDLKDWIKENL